MHTNELAVNTYHQQKHYTALHSYVPIIEDYVCGILDINKLALKHVVSTSTVNRAINLYFRKPERSILLQQKEGDEWPGSFSMTKYKSYLILNNETGIFYTSVKEAANTCNIKYMRLWAMLYRNKGKSNFVLV